MPRTQIIAVVGALLLFVLLFFARTRPPLKPEASRAEGSDAAVNMETVVLQATDSLKGTVASRIKLWKKDFDHATQEQKMSFLDSLSRSWEDLKRPEIAAFYVEKKAIVAADKPDLWNKAGERYYNATRFVSREKVPALFEYAMRCFNKTLSLQPENLDAMTSLGACYVESSADPMKGIGLLRDVIEKDSNQINAQLDLAFFSVKSGQFEKAIARFKRVLVINPGYVEAYLFLADVYEKTGDKKKAIETLEKYVSLVDDETVKNEVNNYIIKLKQS